MRRTGFFVPLALLCLLVPACGGIRSAVGLGHTAGGVNPTTAILLSVPAESVDLVDPVSGTIVPVASGLRDFQSGYATWAPGHRALAYGNAGIVITDPSNHKSHWLVKGQSLSMPAWSPDGKRIVYGNAFSMLTTPVAKSRPHRVMYRASLAPFAFDWSSKNVIAFEGLALNCGFAEGCFSTNHSDIWTVHPNGSGVRQVTHLRHATRPKWSPDGSELLFIRTLAHKKGHLSQLWVVNANGSGLHRLTSAGTVFSRSGAGNVLAADWSASGSKIVLVRQGAVGSTIEVWEASASGTGLRPIATGIPGSDATVDW